MEVEISQGSSTINNSQFYAPQSSGSANGNSIKWTNNDNVIHTVTQGKPSEGANSTGFNSGPIQHGGTFVHFFDESGTVDYFYYPSAHDWKGYRKSVMSGDDRNLKVTVEFRKF